jgi:uncharacterized membrane protein YjfL (UPF0719 family)
MNWTIFVETLLYLGVGILIYILSILIVEKLTPWSLQKELIEDQNIAIAIMFAGFFIGIAIIIGAAIGG